MDYRLAGLLIRHGSAGVAAGWLSVAALLWTDTAGLGVLVARSDLWPMPLLMLLWGFGVTFGSAAMGAAVIGLRLGPSTGGSRRRRRWPARGRGAPVVERADP